CREEPKGTPVRPEFALDPSCPFRVFLLAHRKRDTIDCPNRRTGNRVSAVLRAEFRGGVAKPGEGMGDEQEPRSPSRLRGDAKLTTQAYYLRVMFHPEMRLEPKKGPDFVKALSEVFVPTRTTFQSEAWEFVLPHGSTPNCFTSVVVDPSSVQCLVAQPE